MAVSEAGTCRTGRAGLEADDGFSRRLSAVCDIQTLTTTKAHRTSKGIALMMRDLGNNFLWENWIMSSKMMRREKIRSRLPQRGSRIRHHFLGFVGFSSEKTAHAIRSSRIYRGQIESEQGAEIPIRVYFQQTPFLIDEGAAKFHELKEISDEYPETYRKGPMLPVLMNSGTKASCSRSRCLRCTMSITNPATFCPSRKPSM